MRIVAREVERRNSYRSPCRRTSKGPTDADRASLGILSGRAGGSRSDPPRKFGQGVYREALAVTASLERALRFTPVVYTCGVSVLQELRRTKAVLGGL